MMGQIINNMICAPNRAGPGKLLGVRFSHAQRPTSLRFYLRRNALKYGAKQQSNP